MKQTFLKRFILSIKILIGFGIAFIPYLLPNGRIYFPLGLIWTPFVFINLFLPFPFQLIFLILIIYRVFKKKGMLGWIIGASSALVLGEILFWTQRFNFIPV